MAYFLAMPHHVLFSRNKMHIEKIYIHTCTFIYIHAHSYTYMHIHAHTRTFMHIHVHSCTIIYIHVHSYTYIRGVAEDILVGCVWYHFEIFREDRGCVAPGTTVKQLGRCKHPPPPHLPVPGGSILDFRSCKYTLFRGHTCTFERGFLQANRY